MPVISGLDLVTHMRTEGYNAPFIFITAFPDESVRARAQKSGAICFLAKPFAGPTLITCLETALDGHRGGASTWDGERRRGITHLCLPQRFVSIRRHSKERGISKSHGECAFGLIEAETALISRPLPPDEVSRRFSDRGTKCCPTHHAWRTGSKSHRATSRLYRDLSLKAQIELFLIDANSLFCPLNDITEVQYLW
jgi:DNA-binding response OmpR family regulator